LEVASLLYYAGATDSVVAAGVLHDVIEDTAAAASDLKGRFGRRVTELVVAVSEDGSIADFDLRKAALRAQVHRSVELLEELEPDAALVHRLRDELDQLDAALTRRRYAGLPG